MAHFRAVIRGQRGEASRLGSKSSGIRTNTASWQGAVSVELWHDETTGQDMARVSLSRHHGAGTDKEIYCGPVSGRILTEPDQGPGIALLKDASAGGAKSYEPAA